MARERMVTRTIIETTFDVMAVNLDTKSVETINVKLASVDSMTEKALDKALKESVPNGFVFVQVVNRTDNEVLYGIPENEFIRIAKVLPPR